jgi:5-methylcytosine-specific restriction endonuclease McrA
MAIVKCECCNKDFYVRPARVGKARFCSYRCYGTWAKSSGIRKKERNANYGGGVEKSCVHCKKLFYVQPSLAKQKFCSKDCADVGGFRYSGENHPNYRKDARKRNRSGAHAKWVDLVIARDKATCQECGATEIELHAHHIKSYKDHPELRTDLSNGITLCYKCHWDVHTALTANSVNSVDTLTSDVEGNTEPSLKRKFLEGVTTRGRAYRRWFGFCAYCKTPISKTASDTVGKKNLFCSKSCAGKWRCENIGSPRSMAVNSSKSAGRESDDIV